MEKKLKEGIELEKDSLESDAHYLLRLYNELLAEITQLSHRVSENDNRRGRQCKDLLIRLEKVEGKVPDLALYEAIDDYVNIFHERLENLEGTLQIKKGKVGESLDNNNIIVKCDRCGDRRPESAISIVEHQWDRGAIIITIKYCNDNKACHMFAHDKNSVKKILQRASF